MQWQKFMAALCGVGFVVCVAPATAQYRPDYVGPPINPQEVIREQRHQDDLSRDSSNRVLDRISPTPTTTFPQRQYGPSTVIISDRGRAKRFKASQGKRKASKRRALRSSARRSGRSGRR
jgi:hypothetical protein